MSTTNVRAAEVQTGVIDEIIVTAQKRSESVQDAPVSVSAFADRLDLAVLQPYRRAEYRFSVLSNELTAT